MNSYLKLKHKQQREVDALPFFFAFSNEQFAEGMAKFGLYPNDTHMIYRLSGTGGYYLRTDAPLIHDTFNRHESERQTAIDADTTGNGYIYEMFLYELRNHEYGYTGEIDDTLDALGLTMEEINNSKTLTKGINKAIAKIRKEEK